MVSCGGSLIKYILFAFNLLWLILGGVILWLGFTITTFSGDVKGIVDETFRSGAIVLLVTGFVIFLIAFLGCCGAIKESQCMLWTYGAIILLLVIVQCVGAYLAFHYQKDIEGTIRDGITKNFENYSKTNSSELNGVINKFQKTFHCCGAYNYTDWDGWLHTQGQYPPSCCDRSNDEGWCTKDAVINKGYEKGCIDKAMDKIHTVLGGLGGVAIALILVQFLIVFAACCLVRDIRS